MRKPGNRFPGILIIVLLVIIPCAAADDALLGPQAPKPQPQVSAKIGGLAGDMIDEFEAGGGLSRIVWSAEKQEQFCEDQALRFADLPPDKRADVAGIVIKNCEISIRSYENENKDGKNDRKISGGYVRLAALYDMSGPDYAANRLDALDNAIKADPYYGFAWDQKADFLDEMGFVREAQAVRDEKERRWNELSDTGSGLMELLGIPLSLVPMIAGLILVLFLFRRRNNR